jgi:hypothetical protein
MGFIDSYKHLEKLCGEVLNDDRRVSAYIDEMLSTPDGARFVYSWNEDLKMLKHYRWVRNQIAHEPNCNETNMCQPKDTAWINDFYNRIMNQTDPLTLYHKAKTQCQVNNISKPVTKITINRSVPPTTPKTTYDESNSGCSKYLLPIFFVILGIIVLYFLSNQ